MTIEIYRDLVDAQMQAADLDAFFRGELHPVIKVKVDVRQEGVYGFRYLGSNYEILDTLSEGWIVLDDDWTAEEAAKCGLVKIGDE